jgi:hypothetical protein
MRFKIIINNKECLNPSKDRSPATLAIREVLNSPINLSESTNLRSRFLVGESANN